jgi:RNA polymerase sigma factor (TIGR02999 family)
MLGPNPPNDDAEITQLLGELRGGSAPAQERLASLVYSELRRIAGVYMHQERPDHSLQPTALVNEAFIRLVQSDDRSWQNRAHFFAVAAQVMRRLLIDYARGRRAQKRGSGQAAIEFDDAIALTDGNINEVLAVDQALDRLAKRDVRVARIVEMRFFVGLTEDEIGEALGISARTVKRDWRVAKAWLHGELACVRADD